MQSCIYEGTVSHHRLEPVDHRFEYRLFMVYLDLEELPHLVGNDAIISDRVFSSCSYRRDDHLFAHDRSLADEVRQIVLEQTGQIARGPIRLLTQLRFLGYYFSPLNVFFLFDEHDEELKYVVAEVNNTPWNERHCYVLFSGNRRESQGGQLRFGHDKEFHVSPFMDMEMQYAWQMTTPADSLSIRLTSSRRSKQMFTAGMNLSRQELSKAALRRMTFRYPIMTAQIGVAIYYQALKLWWKRCPFYPHPKKLGPTAPARSLGDKLAS
ncbi:MAG: DUF1365 domain-containing protein [Pirellulales bacterium]|nr:DUF1365 domain-containing protein [Pirellulales bacterium]